jgi:hypothetical protein
MTDYSVWAKSYWILMYDVANNIPDTCTEELNQQYTIFFTNLQHLLPCNLCKEHYNKYLNSKPLSINKNDMISWLDELKINIRKQQQKQQKQQKQAPQPVHREQTVKIERKRTHVFNTDHNIKTKQQPAFGLHTNSKPRVRGACNKCKTGL